ncbi:MAG: hypothetical protein QOK05_1028 [Chloroflexota bacterium]|jgi:hypothetical protein|nr:hypothetical protein [Chloroflexota bacterium]
MNPVLRPHHASYALLDPTGAAAGREELSLEKRAGGYFYLSTLETTYPSETEAEVRWQLDERLVTRLLHIHSVDSWGEEYDLEVTITGNGLLAHRAAPHGPTQVELGWGPRAELDYISAAFPAVIMARSFAGGGSARTVDAVEFGVEDLVPVIVSRRYQRTGQAAEGGITAQCLTEETGHASTVEVSAGGVLLGYEGLLRLEELDAPMK